MADANPRTATLLAFHAHLETMKAQLAGLQVTADAERRQQRDDLGRRAQLFACFQSAVDPALELLNGELRSVIPESAVESTPKAWCVNATKTLDRAALWFRQLGFVHLNQRVYPPIWEAVRHTSSSDGVPLFDSLPDAQQRTETVIRALYELSEDVFRFLHAVEAESEFSTINNATKTTEQSSPVDPNAKVKTDETTEFSFEVHSEVVRIRGFSEDVTLEKTEGVQRLIAIVAAPTRRAAVMGLTRIGVAQSPADSDLIDRDGLTERESVNAERFESALGADALQAARDAIGDLIEERDAALSDGDDDKAERLTEQINVSLNRPRTELQEAAAVVRKSLDRTYDRLRKDGKGKLLAAHFAKYVERPRQSPDYVYEPDESGRKISWNLR